MKIILDTQVTLWLLANDKHLGDDARELLSSSDNEVYYSPVSVLEIAVKHGERPLRLSIDENTFNIMCKKSGLIELPLKASSIVGMQYAIEDSTDDTADPFTKLILAQAIDDNMLLISHNRELAAANEDRMLYV